MGRYNETTARVLEILSERPATAEAIAKKLGCSRSNVTTILLKLRKFGRIDRKQVSKGDVVIRATNPPIVRENLVYVYSITASRKGRLSRILGEE